jgi:phage head maturation protease
MTTDTRVHVSRQAADAKAGPANQLDVVLMPWGAEAEVTDDGRTAYRERWEPGSLIVDGDSVPVYGSHVQTARGLERGPLVGVARNFTDTGDGLRGTIHLATDEGRRIHELAALGVRAAVSIEADAGEPIADDTGVVVRTAAAPAVLTGVATILPPQAPAYAGAQVLAVRAAATLTLEERLAALEAAAATPTEPDEEDPDKPKEDEEEEVTDTPATETAGRAAVAEMVRTEVARYGLERTARPAAHPLTRFDSLQDAMKAGYNDIEIARALGQVMTIGRALVDQITTDPNTGVIHIGWINQVYGIVDQGRPAINAIGTAALPPDGMTINWPTFAGDLTTLVGVQATQKTTITSVKVSIGNASAPLKTFAGGSDISLQLINRSSPSYLESYLRIMAAAYAAVTDKDAATALSAQVTLARNNFVIYDPAAADPTGSILRTAIFTASTKVQAATGQPASVVLCGLTAFVALGGKLTPLPIFNASGSSNASTLAVDVDGLGVVYDPYLAPTEILVTNSLAAQWREEGPQTINATDVERLGQSYAVWGLGLLTPTIPTGIVGLRTVAPTTADEQQAYDDGYLTDPPEKVAKK